METFVVHPPGGAFAPVILYMDMWGIRATLADIARSIAAAGYYCILPDLYYRGGKVSYAAQDIAGRRLSFTDLEPERQTALRAAMDGLSDAMVIDDTAFLLDVMSREQAVRPGTVGAVGYCMGGRHALCVAGTFPEHFKAAACLHGAGLVSAADDLPASCCAPRRRRNLFRPRGTRPVCPSGRRRTGGRGAGRLPRPRPIAGAPSGRARVCDARPQCVRSSRD